jgi:N-acyl-D-amino-acid deacylase
VIRLIYDIAIKNGYIVDGSGEEGYKADIAIQEGKIVRIEPSLDVKATTIIDASDLIVSPGFINIHSHSEMSIEFENKFQSVISQGITTETIGQCGASLAPISDESLDVFEKDLESWLPPGGQIDLSWRSFAEYLRRIEEKKTAVNIVPVVGFGTVRIAGGPGYENREPTTQEYEKMRKYVQESMESGAFGMSTGLIYSPQIYAQTEEVIELAKEVANYNGLYFSHMRDESSDSINALNEFIEIMEKSGCRGGQIAHHKIAGPEFWGLSKETLELIDEANNRGIKVTCDQYPYNRGMTGLTTALPPWAHEGGIEEIVKRLKDPEMRGKMRKDLETGSAPGWENYLKILGSDKIFISQVKVDEWKDIEGKHIAEITKIKNKVDDIETIFDMLLETDCDVSITIESMGEEDIRRIMTSKYSMVGTDGSGVAPTGITSYGKPHPRFYGTYPRILGKYVREEKWLTLEQAIRKMTSFPAQVLGLTDRGLVRENNWADLVIFDSKTVIDKATFLDPHQFSEGIIYVIVNGEIVIENTKQNENLPGKVLKHKK